MNQLIKYNTRLWLLITIAALFASCEKAPNFRIVQYPAQTASDMSPTSGYPGTYVTISGKNFGVLTGAVKVFFGGIKADSVISCADNQIVAKVPAGAITGKVTLQVWTHTNDSIGAYTVIPAPTLTSVLSNSQFGSNIAFPGDTVTLSGSGFGTDASRLSVNFNGTTATILSPVQDNSFRVITPDGYASGSVYLTINGLTLTAGTGLINPNSPGDITKFYLENYGPAFSHGSGYDGSRWGTLAAPWVTNAAAKNKSGGTIGGYADEGWNGVTGFICSETWGNTPITDGMIYQPTALPLPAGSYTFSFVDYSEIQTNSSVYCVVAAGGTGIPTLANLSTALASVAFSNNAVVGTTSPNITETKSVTFTLATSQVVSIGFLINMKWGNGAGDPGCYFIVKYVKLVKN